MPRKFGRAVLEGLRAIARRLMDGRAGPTRNRPCRRRTRAGADRRARRAARRARRRRSGSRRSCRSDSATNSGRTRAQGLIRCVGTNAAASSRTSKPSCCASSTSPSGCWTPEKFDCAGKANSRAPRLRASVSRRRHREAAARRQRDSTDRRAGAARDTRECRSPNCDCRPSARPRPRIERIALGDQLDRRARVGREAHGVVVRIGVEKREHRGARPRWHSCFAATHRCSECGLPNACALTHLMAGVELRSRRQRRARVVEIAHARSSSARTPRSKVRKRTRRRR